MENDENIDSNTITITFDDSIEYNITQDMYSSSTTDTLTNFNITTSSSPMNWNSIVFTGATGPTGTTGTVEPDYSFIDFNGKELIDFMPALEKINEMCSMYPGLKIAFDHFKTIYTLVHDDYTERKNAEYGY